MQRHSNKINSPHQLSTVKLLRKPQTANLALIYQKLHRSSALLCVACVHVLVLQVKDREIYSAVTPNYTVFDIHHPPIFMRKFSPDGLHLVGFSSDLQSLLIYRYQGAGAVGKFFMDPDARMDTEQAQQPLQRDIFTTLFQEKFRLRLIPEANHPHLSCRDFSLYTMDSNYVLLGKNYELWVGLSGDDVLFYAVCTGRTLRSALLSQEMCS